MPETMSKEHVRIPSPAKRASLVALGQLVRLLDKMKVTRSKEVADALRVVDRAIQEAK